MEKREMYNLVLMVIYMMGLCLIGVPLADAKDEEYAPVISACKWDKLVLKSKLPVLVMYTTTPCTKSPNRRYTETCIQNQDELNKLAKSFTGMVKMYRIDIDYYPWFKSTATKYGMNGTDSFAFIERGKLTDTWTSWPGSQQLVSLLA